MALNANHTFEDLGEIKCSIVEKNCTVERVSFLKDLLNLNGYKVIVVNSPPAKVSPPKAESNESISKPTDSVAPIETFTVGVTDLSFNTTNAIFNRELKTADGFIVSPSFWKQLVDKPNIDKWYWEK